MLDAQVIAKLVGRIGVHKQRRDEYVFATCPFCGNTRSNFEVSSTKGQYHCWVCGVGGSVKSLFWKLKIDVDPMLVRVEHVDKTPVKVYSERVVEIPKDARRLIPDFDAVFNTTGIGKIAWDYCAYRNLSAEDVERYQAFVWNNRILFPFYNQCGDLIFWTARSLYKDVNPKYLHVEVNRDDLVVRYYGQSEELCICEGCFDGIALHRQGKDVLMLLGSAITDTVHKYIVAANRKIVFCLDADMREKQAGYVEKYRGLLGKDKVDGLYLSSGDVGVHGFSNDRMGFAGRLKAVFHR